MAFVWASVALPTVVRPVEPVRLYIANDEHTDYLWTADVETYRGVFSTMIDFYLDRADATVGNASPYQSRFNCDGSFWLWTYEHDKTAAEFQRLIDRIKDGHLSAPLNALVSCYGGQPAEGVLRGMYYSGRLERRFGLRFDLVASIENQTMPLGLASLWAGAGAKYSWHGVCGCASQVPYAQLQQRDHEIFWYTGLDGSRVLTKWHSLQSNDASGGYAEARDPTGAVNFLSSDSGFLVRYRAPGAAQPYLVRSAFGYGWDDLMRIPGAGGHFDEVAAAMSNASRQVIASNESDFFRDFEAIYGAVLPAESVTYGNEWDLYSASMAETSAQVRRSLEKLRSAELLATLVALQQPGFLPPRAIARDNAFKNFGLYWEHDWTADGPVARSTRAAWQNQLATEIASYVDTLHSAATTQLGGLIRQTAAGPRFWVLNPLGWTRTDAADFAYSGATDIHVRDLTTSADVPHQFVTAAGISYLRILAPALPSAGYKVFEILPGPGTAPTSPAATTSGTTAVTMDNGVVRLTVNRRGAITSLQDLVHASGELIQSIGSRYANDLGGTDTGTLTIESSGPVSVTVKAVSTAALGHTSRITLFRDSPRIEIRNEITQNFGDVRHWSFSFALATPDVHTEEVGAIIRDKLATAGGHYATKAARYDYATLNHFADIAAGAGGRGVTLSNADCAFVKLGASTTSSLDTSTAQLNVLAGGQVDGTSLGILNQNGASYFLQRFALCPNTGYDGATAMRFSLEHQNPPVVGVVTGSAASPYPERAFSLLRVDQPGVLLWALKPAEEGIAQGVVARLWNVAGAAATATLAPGAVLATAKQVTHLETDLGDLAVARGTLVAGFTAQQIRTFRLGIPTGEPDATALAYENWVARALAAQSVAQQQPEADPDGDGLSNLMEFALDRDPLAADAPGTTLVGGGGGQISLTFQRARVGVSYVVEGSADLATWTVVTTDPGSVGQPVTVNSAAPAGAARYFLRLRVEQL